MPEHPWSSDYKCSIGLQRTHKAAEDTTKRTHPAAPHHVDLDAARVRFEASPELRPCVDYVTKEGC